MDLTARIHIEEGSYWADVPERAAARCDGDPDRPANHSGLTTPGSHAMDQPNPDLIDRYSGCLDTGGKLAATVEGLRDGWR